MNKKIMIAVSVLALAGALIVMLVIPAAYTAGKSSRITAATKAPQATVVPRTTTEVNSLLGYKIEFPAGHAIVHGKYHDEFGPGLMAGTRTKDGVYGVVVMDYDEKEDIEREVEKLGAVVRRRINGPAPEGTRAFEVVIPKGPGMQRTLICLSGRRLYFVIMFNPSGDVPPDEFRKFADSFALLPQSEE